MAFTPQPGRDAQPAIDGYVYQVVATVLAWLNLEEGQHLELEAGEDFDLVEQDATSEATDAARTVQQVHKRSRTITLRSPKTVSAIANFCAHRKTNLETALRFRFLTTAKPGREKGWRIPGIVTWEGIRQVQLNPDEEGSATERIRVLLQTSKKPRGVSDEGWNSFLEVVAASQNDLLKAVIRAFEWAIEIGDSAALETEASRRLSEILPGKSPAVITRAFTHLFAYVFRLLSSKGKRELTTELLQDQLNSPTVTAEDLALAERLLHRLDVIEERLAAVESMIQQHIAEEFPKTFLVDAPAAPAQGTGVLFDYNQVLRGRRLHLDALDAFLSSTGESIAVLPGRGGIGKTKLVREWAGRQTSWNVLWASEMRPWQASAESEIPPGDTLLVVDDAHRYADLAQAIGLVANWQGQQRLKMVITTRPSGRDYVNERLAQFVDETRVLRCPTLKELTLEETMELAEEMLGRGFAHLAPQLAQVSQDTPLVTVVGGRLIAKGEILPDLLGNHEAFQHAVFDKFASECAGQLPAGGKSKEELLHLLAAVQPVDERAPAFDAAAPAFLGLRSDQIRRNVLALEETGIVIRSRDAARIVPDVLADYLLERASVGPNHYVTGYADAVFEAFHEGFLSNLLKNLAELDWRITQRDPQTRLLENIWSRLRETFRTRRAHGRRQMLMEMQKVVAFQPAAVHRLLQLAMDDPAETSYDYGYEITDARVIRVVPELLAVTIYDPESSADAFRRLWLLSKSGPEEETRNHARRVLREAIGYQKYKSLSFNERVLSHVEALARDASAYDGDFTPLDLVNTLLDREISHTERQGRAFTVSALPVHHGNVSPLRTRALETITNCLESSNPRMAVDAVESLAHVLSEYHPGLRGEVTADEQQWHDGERLRALEILTGRVERGSLTLVLVWRIRKLLFWVIERSQLSDHVKRGAELLRGKLELPEDFDVFDSLCADRWEYNTLESEFFSVSERRNQKEQRAVEFLKAQDSISKQITRIERLSKDALDAGIKPEGIDPLLTRLCSDRTFLQGLSDYLLVHPESILAQVAGIAVRIWRDIDQSLFSRYGSALARTGEWRTAGSVADVVCGGPPLEHPIHEDVEVLAALCERKEPAVLGTVLRGLARLGKIPAFRAAAMKLILRIDVGDSEYVARSLCELVGPGHLSPAMLDEPTIRGILSKLITLNELPDETLGTFLAYVGGRVPLAIAEFLEARLNHAIEIKADEGFSRYKPLPSSQFWSSFQGIQESAEYRVTLEKIFSWVRRFPRWIYETFELFWHFGRPDETSFSVLDDALHSTDADDMIAALNILTKAQKELAFNHVAFAMHVLNLCAAHSREKESEAARILQSNCLSLPGGMAVGGGPIPIWGGVGDRARAILEVCEPDSPAFSFYSALAGVAPSQLPILVPDLDEEDE
jgi:hypothetical protein